MTDVRLMDGSLLEIKINFLTVKLISQTGIVELEKKLKLCKSTAKKDEITLEIASKVIYAILRSNGRKVDEEEALMLVPADPSEITILMKDFQEKMEEVKKKQAKRQKAM